MRIPIFRYLGFLLVWDDQLRSILWFAFAINDSGVERNRVLFGAQISWEGHIFDFLS